MAHSFAEKLTRLFGECRGPGGRRYANTEVVDAINAGGQAKISPSYLSELLSGKKDNPSIWTVKALADFFGQPVDYFVEDDFLPTTRSLRPDSSEQPAGAPTTLGERVNLLFTMAAQSGRARPTNAQVASAVTATGSALSARTLSDVRAGGVGELPSDTLTAIADYFGVPAAVLTDDGVAEMLAAQLPAVRLMHDDTVRKIAYRAHALSAADRAIVTGLLDRLAHQDPGMSPDDLPF